mmetsp:Transcript_9466/g.11430  ORF Transcript_9466/g.11430 Transcript_9466/m.11430 type:complete len:478 (-) Transcript_9466:353-1786(-)
MASLLSMSFFNDSSSPSSPTKSNKSDDETKSDQLCVFDDFDALESGEAREFIPYDYLLPSKDWWLCKVKRINHVEFTMHLEPPCGRMIADKFILSAKRVGDDFYISQYENFGSETPPQQVPINRYCAILKSFAHQQSIQSKSIQKNNDTIPKRSWKLLPANLGNNSTTNSYNTTTTIDTITPPLAIITHSMLTQPISKAEIRMVDVQLPDLNSRNSNNNNHSDNTCEDLNSKYKNFDNNNILSEQDRVNEHLYVWDLNRNKRLQNNKPNNHSNNSSNSSNNNSDDDEEEDFHQSDSSDDQNSLSSDSDSSNRCSPMSIRSSSAPTSSSSSISKLSRVVSDNSNNISKNNKNKTNHSNSDLNSDSNSNLNIKVSSQIPQWDPERNSLLMKFLRNRVNETSSKNYVYFNSQEVRGDVGTCNSNKWKNGSSNVYLPNAIVQFGKMKTDVYSLDFRLPVAPLQAFAMALASFPDNPTKSRS